MIDLAFLRRLLNVDESLPLWRLTRAARAVGASFPHLLLSVMERDGIPMGPGSRDELRRARARERVLAEVMSMLSAFAQYRIVKGPSLARLYPPGLLRPVGDLDLVMPAEEHIWEAVQVLTKAYPVTHVDVSLVERPHRNVFVSVYWPAEDPVLDVELSIELYTAAFPGDFRSVGVRAELPRDGATANLVALAEERFQRPFNAKDVIDIVVMSRTNAFDDPSLQATIEAYNLAPEALELLEYAAGYHELHPLLRDLVESLRPAARSEERRRLEHPLFEEESDDVGERLRNGQPVYGMALRRVLWRSGLALAEIAPFDAGYLLRTVVGDYLLVSSGLVDPALHDAALGFLARSDPPTP
jgi:putative nucleotidyltransferase-like protein